jgi:DNA-binding GntR family transcriptional regulator
MNDVLVAFGSLRTELNIPTLSARLAQHIEQLILRGTLRPGARLIEETISRHLGISRASLREAMIGLEAAGLIAREGNARVIRRLGDHDLVELYEMWSILEGEAAAMACQQASARDRAALTKIMGEMETTKDLDRFRELNLDFHQALVGPCPNSRLLDAYTGCIKQIRWAGAISLGVKNEDTKVSCREHRHIAKAYFDKRAQAVRDLVRAHLSAGAGRCLSALSTE